MKKYITYGKGNKLILDLLPEKENLIIEDGPLNKIQETLWGSPVDASFGWKEWCEGENFMTCEKENSFTWTLKDDAKILYIEQISDLEKIPFVELLPGLKVFDFKKIIKEYDAMELSYEYHPFGHMFISKEESAFNSWDCSSIMVFDKNKIIEIV